MRKLRAWAMRFGGLFRREQRECELAEELESNLQFQIEDNVRAGMTPQEARRRALIRLGGMEQTKELYREQRGLPWLETLLQDLRYGARTLRKAAGFTAVAVITLALGIGANTAIFSAVNAVLLRPLPYRHPDRLVWVTEIWHKDHDNALVPNPDYTSWKMQAHSFEEMAAYDGGEQFNLTGAGQPERIETAGVTANFFRTLGVEPFQGRDFRPQEALPGGPPVVILSYELWQSRFGLDPDILQKAITLDNQRFSVVGVMPSSFRFPDPDLKPQLFIPFQLAPGVDWNAAWLTDTYVVARLRKGVSRGQAAAELQTINERDFAQVSPVFVRLGRRNVQVQVLALQRKLAGDVRPALLVLLGAVGFVLLIACVNVANLQLARTAARQQEFAVRAAIGAGRARLVRQLVTESAVLAFLGGVLGLGVGIAGIRLLRGLAPPSLSQLVSINLDLRVLAFTAALTALVSIVSGVLPALAISKPDINEALKHSGLRMAGGRGGQTMRKLLAGTELALALVLLAGSGLLLRSFVLLSRVDPGFDPHRVLTARIKLPEAKYSKPEQQRAFLEQLLQRLRGLPGVESVGLANALPLGGYAGEWAMRFEGEAPLPPGAAPSVPVTSVSSDYFRAMHIGLVAGRFFDESDGTNNVLPVIINRSFARRFFPNQDPLGKRVRVGGLTWPWHSIVGVVADVRHVGLDREAEAQLYRPYAAPPNDPTLTVQTMETTILMLRCKNSPLSLAAVLRRQIAEIDSDLPVFDTATMDQRLANALAAPRFNTTVLGIFAGCALLLAMVGIYGVISYFAALRTHEIGIRMALGAVPASILRLLLREASVIVLAGVMVGVAGALAVSRYMAKLLFEIRPTDPATFVAVSLLLGAVATVASYVPARRAMKVDPTVALRYE